MSIAFYAEPGKKVRTVQVSPLPSAKVVGRVIGYFSTIC